MSELSEHNCEACRAGAPRLSAAELQPLLPQIPQWELFEEAGIARLRRSYHFSNFQLAMAFANQVAELAETQNHHPALTVEWGRVTVCWWTHKIKGLHRNDVIMAAKTDQLS